MMARVVAELGRPETPEETAARKAEFSRNYRSSKTFPSLIGAMLATLAILFIVVLGVPRGTPAAPPPIDVAATAADLSAGLNRPVVSPTAPDSWRVNSARLEGDGVEAWTIVYAPEDDPGFLRVAQGFDAGETWPVETLGGARSTGTVTIDGIVWDEYPSVDPSSAGNVSYALATDAGDDRILIYGSTSAEVAQTAAAGVADDIRDLREETS
jgi:hypothetical protein